MIQLLFTPLNLFLSGILLLIVVFGMIGAMSTHKKDHTRGH